MCKKQNVRISYQFDTIVGAIDDPDKHEHVAALENMNKSKYQFGQYKIINKSDLKEYFSIDN